MPFVQTTVNNCRQIFSKARPANKQIFNLKQKTTYKITRSITRFDTGYKTSGIQQCVIVWRVSDASREHSTSIFWGSCYWHYDIFVKCCWVATLLQQYSTHLHTNSTQNDTKKRYTEQHKNFGRVRAVPRLCGFYVWLTVHRSSVWNKKPTRCHLVLYLFLLISCSKCFGPPCAHLQEPTT